MLGWINLINMERFKYIFGKLKNNSLAIFKLFLVIAGSCFSVLSIGLLFFDWNDLCITDTKPRIWILIGTLLGSIFASAVVILCKKTKKIWAKGNNKVCAIYSDIFKIGFKNRKQESKIVVIQVNDTFETIVEESSETIKNPLVSPNTNHGKWINRFCKEENITPEQLNERIQANLELNGYKPKVIYTKTEKPRGNLKSYELGTTAIIDGSNNTKYYLVAISKFDKSNNAHALRKDIRESLESLISFYVSKGQSDEIFIPLFGTGNSRSQLTHKQSFKLMKTTILTSDSIITGKINLVVYDKDKDKVSIFE